MPIPSRGPLTRQPAITLKPKIRNRNIPDTQQSYDIYLNGVVFGELYYNLRGYQGYLPTPEGKSLDIGECAMTAYKKEIARLNRQFRKLTRPAVPARCPGSTD